MALTWLHVSDFHLSSKAPYKSDVVLKALVDAVEWHRQQTEWKPELIFATGDIAGNGDIKVFEGGKDAIATQYFDALLKAADQGKERLFIVPGNHDVDRNKGIGLVRTLDTQDEIDEYFTKSPMYHLTYKLEAFAAWYNDYFSEIPIPRSFPVKSTCELISFEISNVRLELLHLNSALFCKEAESDDGKLCIGRSCLKLQLDELKKKKNIDLAIALVHHPFRSLHRPCELYQIKNSMQDHVDIFLHGHDHQVDIDQGGKLLQLAAGAAYMDKGSKRALYGRFDGTKIDVYPICCQEGTDVWRVDSSVFPDEPTSMKSFILPGRTSSSSPSPSVTPSPDSHTALDYAKRYQDSLKAELDHLLPPAIQSFSPKLSDVYVTLNLSYKRHGEDCLTTETRKLEEQTENQNSDSERVMTPEKVMLSLPAKNYRILLLIGAPGSGKTTLLQHYALSCLDKDPAKNRYKEFGFTEPVMVFYLLLRELNPTVNLPANIFAWSEIYSLAIPEQFFLDSLRNKKTLVLLDGLDEISDLKERRKVCRWIDTAEKSFLNATFIITSRPTGIRKIDKIGISVPHATAEIRDFDPGQQATFLKKWFETVFLDDLPDHADDATVSSKKGEAYKKAEALVAFLAEPQNLGLRHMAGVPILLQIMALFWNKYNDLSFNRATLYENALDYMLDYQYEQKNMVSLLAVADAIKVLSPVSLWMQETPKSDEIDRALMKKKIQIELNKMPQQNHPPTAEDFCKVDLVERAGLLVEYGKQEYLFRHKSFREYLVAVHLISQVNKVSAIKKLIKNFDDSWWEQPLYYFFQQIDEKSFDGFMQHFFKDSQSDDLTQKKQQLLQALIKDTPKEQKKIDALCKKLLDPATTASRQWVILDCLKAIGRQEALVALQEFRAKNFAKNDTLDVTGHTAEVIRALGGKVIDPEAEKVVYGTTLSILNPNEQNAEYILIKKGSFLDSETNERKEVDKDLYFAKYPVTNKLYRSFIEALGDSSKLQEELNKIVKNNSWDEGFSIYFNEGKNDIATLFRSEYDEDREFGGDDQPVVGISWYAAQAYCLWLSQRAGKPDSYRLPKEDQWEWAAGGRQGEAVQKVRKYPWADAKGEPDQKLLNYEGNVGQTTPVGSYPDGATPEGLYDMAGNVWEWTDSWYDDSCSNRVIRGGSWDAPAEYCRSAYRGSFTPVYRFNFVGFRPVFVP
jgi:formylglycine-generating enzyme required for sulfatase activity/predicted phosphodiesterase/energy-coupling factor transporter ATP-binding protein EcfA2